LLTGRDQVPRVPRVLCESGPAAADRERRQIRHPRGACSGAAGGFVCARCDDLRMTVERELRQLLERPLRLEDRQLRRELELLTEVETDQLEQTKLLGLLECLRLQQCDFRTAALDFRLCRVEPRCCTCVVTRLCELQCFIGCGELALRDSYCIARAQRC